jgi:hypothetical protein
MIGFTDQLHIVTTCSYNAIANSHILQFTTAYTKSSQFVVTSRFLVTDPKDPYRLANVSQETPRLVPVSHQPPTLLMD